MEYSTLLHARDFINYTVSEIEKCSGGFRTIYNPCRELKQVQRRIKNLLSRISIPSWVFSGRKDVCHVDNGKYHEHSVYFIQSDLHAFYDTCTRERVYRLFKDRFKCSSDVSALLSDLTTLTLEDGSTVIPTGSPCAQLVAFLAYQDMFNELHNLARNQGYKFSLYVDDLTFSPKSHLVIQQYLRRSFSKSLSGMGTLYRSVRPHIAARMKPNSYRRCYHQRRCFGYSE